MTMGCLIKIRELMPSLTTTERKIASYIIDHYEEVVHLSTQELAKAANVSTAAVTRFSYRLRYRGFPAMKLALAKEQGEECEEKEERIRFEDSLGEIMKRNRDYLISLVKKTYQMIQPEELEEAVLKIAKAPKVYIFGVGDSGAVCNDLYVKLTKIGKSVIYYNDVHVQRMSMQHITEEDVFIAISYSGETKEVLSLVEEAKAVQAPIISITHISNNSLAKVSEFIFYMPTQEQVEGIGAYHQTAVMITDLFQIGLLKLMSNREK